MEMPEEQEEQDPVPVPVAVSESIWATPAIFSPSSAVQPVEVASSEAVECVEMGEVMEDNSPTWLAGGNME